MSALHSSSRFVRSHKYAELHRIIDIIPLFMYQFQYPFAYRHFLHLKKNPLICNSIFLIILSCQIFPPGPESSSGHKTPGPYIPCCPPKFYPLRHAVLPPVQPKIHTLFLFPIRVMEALLSEVLYAKIAQASKPDRFFFTNGLIQFLMIRTIIC